MRTTDSEQETINRRHDAMKRFNVYIAGHSTVEEFDQVSEH